MIKRYSEWSRINEVDELTEPKLIGKYIDRIIQTYQSSPNARPSRDVSLFPNAKETQPLSTFIKSRSGKTSAEIILSVIDDWYEWPSESQAKKVLTGYIRNEDDLSNLSSFGLPFGKVIQQDPTLALIGSGGALKAGGKLLKSGVRGTKKLFSWVPKLFGVKESRQQSDVNEGFIVGLVASFVIGSLLSATTKYSLYGKESIEDDVLLSWTTPYLPDINPIIGDDPIVATYVNVYNVMMMIVYDAWNLCMGQEKYGSEPNPIMSWQERSNYITEYYRTYYESDPDIKSSFIGFMSSLRSACLQDMKNPKIFQDTPFYYTGDKVRVNFEDGRTENIDLSNWFKWLRENYKAYIFVPLSKTEFDAKKRDGKFAPLSPLGVSDEPKGDPTRQITMQLPDGSVSNLSLLELEIYLLNSKNTNLYEIETQDIIEGGSSIVLKESEQAEDGGTIQSDIPAKNPTVVKGSTLKEIVSNIQSEELSSFVGMGDV